MTGWISGADLIFNDDLTEKDEPDMTLQIRHTIGVTNNAAVTRFGMSPRSTATISVYSGPHRSPASTDPAAGSAQGFHWNVDGTSHKGMIGSTAALETLLTDGGLTVA